MSDAKDWPPRLHMATLTPAEHAKFLRGLIELTAKNSRDWDNIEQILAQYLTDAYKGGVADERGRASRICETILPSWGTWEDAESAVHKCVVAIRAGEKCD